MHSKGTHCTQMVWDFEPKSCIWPVSSIKILQSKRSMWVLFCQLLHQLCLYEEKPNVTCLLREQEIYQNKCCVSVIGVLINKKILFIRLAIRAN